jgi:DNA-binding response OmpR family regulator
MTSYRILLADDDAHFRGLIEHVLTEAGFDVRCVKGGDEALVFLKNQRVDMAILDGAMPNLDGFQVLRAMRSNPRTRAIPVMMLTSLRQASHLKEAMDAGATDYLTKPVSPKRLVTRLRARLREDRVIWV